MTFCNGLVEVCKKDIKNTKQGACLKEYLKKTVDTSVSDTEEDSVMDELLTEGTSKTLYYLSEIHCISEDGQEETCLYRYTYDVSGRMTAGTDSCGNGYMTNVYDEKGRIVSQTDANDITTTYAYDTTTEYQRTITTITYADGSTKKQVFNAQGYVICCAIIFL